MQEWIEDDPDPNSVYELTELINQLPESAAELGERFTSRLTFGTAGLRGPMRAGPNGMNHAVVRRAARGLVTYVEKAGIAGPIVIGYDARWNSHAYAMETAAVVAGAGRTPYLLPRPLPTPLLAFAIRDLRAAAGVMVTASHNPAGDNGYKVYLSDGIQIVPPADAEIEAAIAGAEPNSAIPLGTAHETLSEAFINSYVDKTVQYVSPHQPRDLRIAYTPLHGVGGELAPRVLTAAGFSAPKVVPAQADPDPRFPTVAFPNPEEPGALDLLLTFAAEHNAELALANDPDADRCAAAIPDPANPGHWRVLTGDELGILLADHVMRTDGRSENDAYITTLVSSTLLSKMCTARRLPYACTLTGFKWIMRGSPTIAFGYEEALGYSIAPQLVRDKDGISAALATADLTHALKEEGQTLSDRLDEIYLEFGVHHTSQLSLRFDELTDIAATMRHLRSSLPTQLLGQPVRDVRDLLTSPEARPNDHPGIPSDIRSDVVVISTDTARVVVRPSGTEPKLKAYLETRTDPPGSLDALAAAKTKNAKDMTALRKEITALLNG